MSVQIMIQTETPTIALPAIPAKRYFTIGEVSELCAVKPHVLRYWEQEFTQLKPIKRRGNRRWITGQWWISVFYYVWAAFIQERIEHNSNFDIYPFLTSGQCHLVHHTNPEKNYGLFSPIWDIVFDTFKRH